MRFLEALLGSIGIMAVGFLTIPLAGHIAGVDISMAQASKMSAAFFLGRLLWLWALRCNFDSVVAWLRNKVGWV